MRLRNTIENSRKATKGLAGILKSKAYWVDTAAGASFWTPIMAANEYREGMESEEVLKARALGILVGVCINRPMLKLRDYWAGAVWGINEHSSKGKRIAADLSLGAIVVPTIYGAVLGCSGQDMESIGEVLPSGSAIQLGVGMLYVQYATFLRNIFGTNPSKEKNKERASAKYELQ